LAKAARPDNFAISAAAWVIRIGESRMKTTLGRGRQHLVA
jgi:hypothetical protein